MKVFCYLLIVVLTAGIVSCSRNKQESLKYEIHDFGTKVYDEPFLLYSKRPMFLVKSLEYTPQWLLTDTITLEKTFIIGFNEESLRSNATSVLKMVDSVGNKLEGIDVFFNGIKSPNGVFNITAKKQTPIKEEEVTIKLVLDPRLGEKEIKGVFVLESNSIDEVNNIAFQETSLKIGEWKAKQKMGWPIILWLIWLLVFLFVIRTFFYLLKIAFLKDS